MATEVIMPQMGFDMTEGTVVRWLKKPGDPIERGEPIVEVETDKATVEVEAFASGILRRIVVEEGKTVPVGEVIGLIGAEDEEVPEEEDKKPASKKDVKAEGKEEEESSAKVEEKTAHKEEAPEPQKARKKEEGPEEEEQAEEEEKGERVLASPLARRVAEEKRIDLGQVKGSGPKGRITKDDVLAFAEKQEEEKPPAKERAAKETVPTPATGPVTTNGVQVEELSRMGQTIARRMAQAKREMPHFYVTVDIDMGRALDLREELNQLYGKEVRISVNDMIVKATALALKKYPRFNSYFEENKIKQNKTLNIGIAIALEDGLIAPAILDCGNKTLKEIALASHDLAKRARGGVLKPEEYTAATISITNLGMFDVENFIAIINPMQSVSVAVGSIREKPAVRDGKIVVASIMQATVSADHRVVNGADAAQFINEIKNYLQKPAALLVE